MSTPATRRLGKLTQDSAPGANSPEHTLRPLWSTRTATVRRAPGGAVLTAVLPGKAVPLRFSTQMSPETQFPRCPSSSRQLLSQTCLSPKVSPLPPQADPSHTPPPLTPTPCPAQPSFLSRHPLPHQKQQTSCRDPRKLTERTPGLEATPPWAPRPGPRALGTPPYPAPPWAPFGRPDILPLRSPATT